MDKYEQRELDSWIKLVLHGAWMTIDDIMQQPQIKALPYAGKLEVTECVDYLAELGILDWNDDNSDTRYMY